MILDRFDEEGVMVVCFGGLQEVSSAGKIFARTKGWYRWQTSKEIFQGIMPGVFRLFVKADNPQALFTKSPSQRSQSAVRAHVPPVCLQKENFTCFFQR